MRLGPPSSVRLRSLASSVPIAIGSLNVTCKLLTGDVVGLGDTLEMLVIDGWSTLIGT